MPRRRQGSATPRRPRSRSPSTRTTCRSPAGGRVVDAATVADDRIVTVAVHGGGAVQLSRDLDEVQHVLAPAGSLRRHRDLVTLLAALVGWLIASRVTRPVTPDGGHGGHRRERPPRRRRAVRRVGRDRPPLAQLRDDARRPASLPGAAAAARAGRRPRAAHAADEPAHERRRPAPPPRPRAGHPRSRARRHRLRAARADRRHQRAGRARRPRTPTTSRPSWSTSTRLARRAPRGPSGDAVARSWWMPSPGP